MATGDTLAVFSPNANDPPASAYATRDNRNNIPVLDFDADTDEEAIFGGSLPDHYGGGGLTVTLVWMASTATSGNCDWEAQIERHEDDAVDLDTDSFAAVQGVIAAAANVSGEPSYDDITFTSGAQMDGLLANESFRIKIRRDANDATNDTMTGDAELMRVIITET